MRQGRRLVVPPAQVYRLRARRLLRQLALAARRRARRRHRPPGDQELRTG
ncbi:hypothetical protein SCOCK_100018 [Actinacidiphila cocklensis]|uniref:Uncharacterized protein n=1 Tax=Actinacidiphila cocklensis TaxID=887465 RepID=A0A9W4DIN8_9ACTN|nr:hypothetical protein SCOCK_100018 [Actinacidiphila cocklensis]